MSGYIAGDEGKMGYFSPGFINNNDSPPNAVSLDTRGCANSQSQLHTYLPV